MFMIILWFEGIKVMVVDLYCFLVYGIVKFGEDDFLVMINLIRLSVVLFFLKFGVFW